MTTVVAWAGVDQRSVASLYLASDSRITWPGGATWDRATKVFCAQLQPHLFAFAGDAFFMSQVLSQVVALVDNGLLFSSDCDPQLCFERVVHKVKGSLIAGYPEHDKTRFDLLHAFRKGEGMSSSFHLFRADFDGFRSCQVSALAMPTRSQLLSVLGSGAPAFRVSFGAWSSSEAGGTSRAVFPALADAIRAGRDPKTGGPPQLAGLYRSGGARPMGVVWEGRRWVLGSELGNQRVKQLKWHNDLFEVVDPETLSRAPDAQPQPRPRGL